MLFILPILLLIADLPAFQPIDPLPTMHIFFQALFVHVLNYLTAMSYIRTALQSNMTGFSR